LLLPICLEPELSTFPINAQIPQGYKVFNRFAATNDMTKVVFSWNCLCGLENIACTIWVGISEDYCWFPRERNFLAWAFANSRFPSCS